MCTKSNFIKAINTNSLTVGRNNLLTPMLATALLNHVDMDVVEDCAAEYSQHHHLTQGYDLLNIGYLKFFDTNKPLVLEFMKNNAIAKGYGTDLAGMVDYITVGSDCVFTENTKQALTIGATIGQRDEDDYDLHNHYDAVAEFCVSDCIIQLCCCYTEFLEKSVA